MEQTILDEAQALVYGERHDTYGPPSEDFAKTAKMITGLLLPKLKDGCEVTAREAVMFMVCVKLSREVYKSKRDNRVDGVGYIALLQMIEDEQGS